MDMRSTRAGQEMRFHLALIAKLALASSLITTLGMVLLTLYLAPETGGDYIAQISGYMLSSERLVSSLIFVSLLLIAIVGVTIWAIALYSSFRIAGPIYRLCRNLEQTIQGSNQPHIPLRRADCLQGESMALTAAVEAINDFYRQLEADVDTALMVVTAGETAEVLAALERIRKAGTHVKA